MSRVTFTGHATRDRAARNAAVSAARAGWLGRLARDLDLFDLLDDIYDRQEEVEFAIYRAHHARAVHAASPLALNLLAHLGFEPDALVCGLRPRGDWRRWFCGLRPPKAEYFARIASGMTSRYSDDAVGEEFFLHGGTIVRAWSDPAGALGIRLSPGGLEVGARIGQVHLRTIEGLAMITTAIPVPETVKASAIGLPVDAVFGHPVLSGRGYVISDQYDREPTADDPREAWRIEFEADPVPWTVPWARAGNGQVAARLVA